MKLRAYTPDELEFMDRLKLRLGAHPSLRWWRQNVGSVPVRNERGKVMRVFHAGPPNGASDLSGIVRPEGWRLEVELKSATGSRSPEQIRWADFITTSGGVYTCAGYDPGLSLAENVEIAAAAVLAAIDRRRRHAAPPH